MRDAKRIFSIFCLGDRIGTTVIYNESEVYYDVGVRLKGSQRGRWKDVRVGFNIAFDPMNLFRDVHGF